MTSGYKYTVLPYIYFFSKLNDYYKSMDYQGFSKHTFTYDFDDYFNGHEGESIAFLRSNEPVAFVTNLPEIHKFDEVCYYCCSYLRLNDFGKPLALLVPGDDGNFYFIGSNYIDYAMFSQDSYSFDIGAGYVDIDSRELEDLSLPHNYGQVTQVGESSPGYDEYTLLNVTDTVVFDYSNLHYVNNGYQTDCLTVRGEDVQFYYTVLQIHFDNIGVFSFSYGRPFADEREAAYSSGYYAGNAAGYVTGFDNGFTTGQGSPSITTEEANAFSYITTAFNGVANLMSIEIIPNITLGLCFSIPLVFVLIMTIFKLVRK